MPLVEVKVLENVFSQAQKLELIERMTDVFIDLEGEHMRPVTTVLVEEVSGGSWGIGGTALSASDVAALKAAAAR
jgi:4-oxalocrotonate tautomerase